MLKFVGNVVWFICGGAVVSLVWLLGAVLFAISIIGLPISRAAFEIAKMSAFPFGKEVVHVRDLDGKGVTAVTAVTGTVGFIANLVWLFTFGLALFVGHVVAGLLACITIIGIPFGIQSFKLAGLSLWPVGRRVVSKELAGIAVRENAEAQFRRIRAA